MRASCGGGAAAWVAGVLAAPGTQGGWQLGQQEIESSRRLWQPVLANMPVFLPGEPPLPDREAWQTTVYRWQRVGHHRSNPACIDASHVLPVAALPQGELSVKVAQLLGLRGPGRRTGLPLPQELRPYQSFFEPLVAGDQKASLASLSL